MKHLYEGKHVHLPIIREGTILADTDEAPSDDVFAGLTAGTAPAGRKPSGRHSATLQLDRTQVRHLAKIVEHFVGQHGGTLDGAARALDCNRVTLGNIRALPSALSITHGMIARMAAAVGATVGQLLGGEVELGEPPTPAKGRVIVRHGRRQ